ncbi:MAG TPA: anhydro-N-acetylmuramic acid kinase [Steroidobacteraceae bacterium]|jgi:anhydro-N-acetylmuramic acid kinase|nr:anhydro-N-acetylmuramic acid kinase [Steroidobacteraceae bacterium]
MDLYLGLISGTSMDAVDAALVDFGASPLSLIAASAVPFDPELKARITAAIESHEQVSLDEIGQLDVAVAREFSKSVRELLRRAGVNAADVSAIGSHGQTLRHRPDLPIPFTWQIGDPSTLAELTGITVVGDLRRRDVAAGGQGAPLLPVFHDQVFRSDAQDRVILNLGGIANITILARGREVSGFDTGPASRLLDAWISHHSDREFDEQGAWASSGRIDAGLLNRLLAEPYLALPAPKSTGRELFNLAWLLDRLGSEKRRPEDVQATLLEYTAATVADAIRRYCPGASVYACGGGAHNTALLEALGRRLSPALVTTTSSLNLDPDYVEAIAFAWFARRTLAGLPSSAPSVTGARGARILGGVFPR